MNKKYLLFIILILTNCAVFRPAKTLDSIIIDLKHYTKDKNKNYADKNNFNLMKIATDIRNTFSHIELEFCDPPQDKNALGLWYGFNQEYPDSIFLNCCVYTTTKYNTLQTDFMNRRVYYI